MTATPKSSKAAVAFILVTMVIDILGVGIIVPILPELVKELVGGDTASAGRYVGVIIAVYALAQFFFAPVLGALSDHFGRRPVLLISLFGLGIDYLIQGFAPTIGWLFVGRLIAGVMGASITTANAYIADISTAETRARNFGLVGVAFGVGFIIGPVIGGLLGAIDLRLPFFVSAGLVLVNCLYGFFVLPESLPVEKRDRFALAKANPLSSIVILRSYPLVAGLAVAFVFLSLAQRGLESVWVLHSSFRYGWNEQANGLALALVGLSIVAVQGLLIKPAIARFGERKAVLLGLIVSTLTYVGYGLANRGWVLLVVIVLGSLGGIAGPAIQGLVAGSVSASDQGKVQGALTSLMSLTSIFAPLIFASWLFSYFTSSQAPFLLPGAPFLLGSVIMLFALVVIARVFSRMPEAAVTESNIAPDGSETEVRDVP